MLELVGLHRVAAIKRVEDRRRIDVEPDVPAPAPVVDALDVLVKATVDAAI